MPQSDLGTEFCSKTTYRRPASMVRFSLGYFCCINDGILFSFDTDFSKREALRSHQLFSVVPHAIKVIKVSSLF